MVNPLYRRLDGEVRNANGKFSRALAVFGALNIEQEIDPAKMDAFTLLFSSARFAAAGRLLR